MVDPPVGTSESNGENAKVVTREGPAIDVGGLRLVYTEHPDDYDHARWLVRLSYLYHVNVLKKTPAGAEEYAAVDVESELGSLDPTDAVRSAFERRPGKAGAPER